MFSKIKSTQNSKEFLEAKAAAIKAEHKKNYEAALHEWCRALTLESSNSERHLALHRLGNIYILLFDNEKARESYDEAVKLMPDNYHGYEGRAAANFYLGNFELAKQDFDKIVATKEARSSDYIRRGQMHYAMGNFTEALADCATAFVQLNLDNEFGDSPDPTSCIDLHILRAQIYEAQDNKAAALAEYQTAKKHVARMYSAHGYNAYICEKLQQLGDTKLLFNGNNKFLVPLMLQHSRAGDYVTAQKLLQQYLSRGKVGQPIYLHTDFMRCMRKIEKHTREEKTAVDAKPYSEAAVIFLARLEKNYCLQQEIISEYREDKDSAELVKSSYDKMIALNPEKSDVCYVERAWWYIGREEHDKALEDMKAAINLNKDYVLNLLQQMKVLVDKKDPAAESYYQLLSNPDYYKHLPIHAMPELIALSKARKLETAALAPMVRGYLTMADATFSKSWRKKEFTNLSATVLCEVALDTTTYLLSELAQHEAKLVRIEKALAEKGITINQAEKIQANTALYQHIGKGSPALFTQIQKLTGLDKIIGDEMKPVVSISNP